MLRPFLTVAGLGLLTVHHAAGQTPYEHRVHHFHVYVGMGGQFLGLGYGEVGEIRGFHHFPVTGDDAQSPGGQQAQYKHKSRPQEDVFPNPLGVFGHFLHFLFIFISHASISIYPCEVTKNNS